MPDNEQVDILKRGAAAWNEWRAASPGVRPDLSGADLSDLNLEGVNLGEADLSDAELYGTNLRHANLKMAVLAGADLSGADLTGAELYKVDASGAYLTEANLSESYLAEANLLGTDLRGARLDGTDLTSANLTSANLSQASLTGAKLAGANIANVNLRHATLEKIDMVDLKYGSFSSMKGHYHGIRGLESCYGNALFVRDAQDQDYLDTLEKRIEQMPSAARRALARTFFSVWGLIDYGRSLGRPFLYAIMLAFVYGVIYSLDMSLGWGLMDYSGSAQSWLTPFYYSIVTYTTLGFGDITPKSGLGEIIIITEVVMGYVTLGLLLSILANKVARRS